ncbi:hypothetical protein [Bradyrhizobium liaoningense]
MYADVEVDVAQIVHGFAEANGLELGGGGNAGSEQRRGADSGGDNGRGGKEGAAAERTAARRRGTNTVGHGADYSREMLTGQPKDLAPTAPHQAEISDAICLRFGAAPQYVTPLTQSAGAWPEDAALLPAASSRCRIRHRVRTVFVISDILTA